MAKRFVFEGSRREFDASADYAIILSFLQDRRSNLILGCSFLAMFLLCLLVFICFHDTVHALTLLAACQIGRAHV